MATRSRIAKQNPDGTIKSVYCHWDGYPSNNGALLLEHYNNEEIIDKLISGGAISSLGERIDPIGKSHNFDNKEEGTTVYYHRDRCEELEISKYINLVEFNLKSNRMQFNYLWKNGKWYCNGRVLTPKMCKE